MVEKRERMYLSLGGLMVEKWEGMYLSFDDLMVEKREGMYLSLDDLMVEKMRMLSAVRVRMGPSSVVISGWKLYSTVVYLPMTILRLIIS